MVKTFGNIIDELEDFSNSHLYINEFGWGEPSQISATKNEKYPLLWLNPTTSYNEGKLMTLNFEMLVLDILDQDLANKKEVMNDTLLIGNDVVKNYWSNEIVNDFTLDEQSVSFTPYMRVQDGFLAGWLFDISIEIENRLSTCSIPKR